MIAVLLNSDLSEVFRIPSFRFKKMLHQGLPTISVFSSEDTTLVDLDAVQRTLKLFKDDGETLVKSYDVVFRQSELHPYDPYTESISSIEFEIKGTS